MDEERGDRRSERQGERCLVRLVRLQHVRVSELTSWACHIALERLQVSAQCWTQAHPGLKRDTVCAQRHLQVLAFRFVSGLSLAGWDQVPLPPVPEPSVKSPRNLQGEMGHHPRLIAAHALIPFFS